MEWTRFLKTCQEFYSFSEERISVLGQGKWMNWGNLGKDHCLKFGFPWKPTLRPRLEKQVCCLGLVSRKHWEVRQGREGSLSRVHFQADSHCGQRKINSTREFWEPEQKHTSELRPSKEEGMEIFVHQLLFVRSLYLAFFFFFFFFCFAGGPQRQVGWCVLRWWDSSKVSAQRLYRASHQQSSTRKKQWPVWAWKTQACTESATRSLFEIRLPGFSFLFAVWPWASYLTSPVLSVGWEIWWYRPPPDDHED